MRVCVCMMGPQGPLRVWLVRWGLIYQEPVGDSKPLGNRRWHFPFLVRVQRASIGLPRAVEGSPAALPQVWEVPRLRIAIKAGSTWGP